MIVRGLKREDIPALAELHIAAWQVAYRGILPETMLDNLSIGAAKARWLKIIRDGDRTTLVAELKGRAVGFVGFGASRDEDEMPDVGEVYAIYVHPKNWSVGVGTALLKQALGVLRQRNFEEATVWTMRDNDQAKRFYEKNGFFFDGREKESGRPGARYQEIRYRREI